MNWQSNVLQLWNFTFDCTFALSYFLTYINEFIPLLRTQLADKN